MQNAQQKVEETAQHIKARLNRSSSFNLEGQYSNDLFHRIMVRLKVHKVVKHWKKLYRNSFNRYKRIQQWVNTEKAYIEDLKLIVNQIQKPLREKGLITQDEERIIFPNMNGIIMLSEEMHSTMKSILDNWHPFKTEIAPAVIKLSSFFKIYIEYFNNYLKGKQILDGIRDKTQVKAIQKSLKMDFDSYLSKPTQRPVKYKLLLTDYQKKLRMDHPDYSALDKAIGIYHQVVQKTNEALQNQKRMRRMVHIESKFKNILQSSRQWKFQFDTYLQQPQNRCKIYVFTDLLLVVSTRYNKQQLLCKMFIDGHSFVQACEQTIDERMKKIFISGKEHNGYFLFQDLDQRNRIFLQLSRLINSLHLNQWKRKQLISKVQSRRLSSVRFSKPYFVEDYYEDYDQYNKLKKKFRITVVGVERRYINKCKNSYFVIKLQLPFPEVINQKAFVKFQDLQDLQFLLKNSLQKWALVKEQNFNQISWKSVSQMPKQLAKGSHLQSDSKAVEFRASRIQSFLNFVLRNKQTIKSTNLIFFKLKMFQSLYEYLTDDKNECIICQICENGDIISNFDKYQQQLNSRIAIREQRGEQNFCTYRTFHVQNKLASQIKQNVRCTAEQIMLYVNSKLGIINQTLTNRIIQGQSLIFTVYRPQYRDIQNEKTQIRSKSYPLIIYKRDTVGDVLQLLRKLLKLNGIKDFGLVLTNRQRVSYLLHEDEYIYDIIRENNLNIENPEAENKLQVKNTSSLRGFFSKIKTSFQGKIDQIRQKTPTTRIQLRKTYVFPAQVQSLTCSQDNVRRQILCDEIFYEFKNKKINLHHQHIVKLCTLFVCIEYNDRIKMLKKTDISKPVLEPIFSSTRLYIVDQNFRKEVWKYVEIYQQKKIFQKQIFQTQLISLINDNQGWNTQFFLAQNLIPKCFFGVNEVDCKIGINWQFFVVVRENNIMSCLVKIRLDKLKIKYSGFIISITEDQNQYRFLCDNIFMFRTVLQKYEAYNKYFLGINKTLERPIMEETF